jgi:DNA-directed RNA polymerase specialized sigma24 family protein
MSEAREFPAVPSSVTLDDETVDKLIRQAARLLRRQAPPDVEADDLHQIAALALLEAKAAGKPTRAENPRDRRHAENWMRRKCVWAMLDGIRESFAQRPNHTYSLDEPRGDGSDGHPEQQVAPDDPERAAQLRQALARLDRKGSPQLIECARLLATGMTPVEVALEMNKTGSRISQLRSEARGLMEPCL